MNILAKRLDEIRKIKLDKLFNSLIKNGKIKKFDEKFYSQFSEMYFNGLPVYYYLQEMNVGKCYDTSAILSLALGNDNYVCRGELRILSKIHREKFDHGWVEDEEYVYDTTWQIVCPKKIYYKLFDVKNLGKKKSAEFFEECKEISDWKIRNKEYYETEHTLNTVLIHQVKAYESKKLESQNLSTKEREFSLQVLCDLPKIDHLRPPTIDEILKKQ